MITNFNIFESLLNKGAPRVGYYIVAGGSRFSGSLADAIKNQIWQIKSIKYSRENKIPYLGLCLGMQTAVIEFGRNICKLENANSSEFDTETKHPVIDLMEEQVTVSEKGGTMRLGAYPCKIKKGTLLDALYNDGDVIQERHRHRYEFNNKYKAQFEKAGMVFSGIYEEKNLVEVIELPSHPFFIATQYHPEFKSRPNRPHPVFVGFVKAATNKLEEQEKLFIA